jgi:hypothetical protein
MTEANPSGSMGCLLAMPTNYRQGWKRLTVTNALTYCSIAVIVAVKNYGTDYCLSPISFWSLPEKENSKKWCCAISSSCKFIYCLKVDTTPLKSLSIMTNTLAYSKSELIKNIKIYGTDCCLSPIFVWSLRAKEHRRRGD